MMVTYNNRIRQRVVTVSLENLETSLHGFISQGDWIVSVSPSYESTTRGSQMNGYVVVLEQEVVDFNSKKGDE